jgi:hypothetical protein
VAKKKDKKKGKKTKTVRVDDEWSALDEPESTEGWETAAARMMVAEEILFQRWEEPGSAMSWVGELLGAPVDQPGSFWVFGMGS